MFSKFLLTLVLSFSIFATLINAGEVYLDPCTEGGGGPATNVRVYVTSNPDYDVNGYPPLHLKSGILYNLTLTFTAPFTIPAGIFVATAISTGWCGVPTPPLVLDLLPPIITSTAPFFGPYLANQQATVSVTVTIPPIFQGFDGILTGKLISAPNLNLPLQYNTLITCREAAIKIEANPLVFVCPFCT